MRSLLEAKPDSFKKRRHPVQRLVISLMTRVGHHIGPCWMKALKSEFMILLGNEPGNGTPHSPWGGIEYGSMRASQPVDRGGGDLKRGLTTGFFTKLKSRGA
jgi:hypothetical protein